MPRLRIIWFALTALVGILPVSATDIAAQSVLRRAKAEAKNRIVHRKQAKEDSIVARTGDTVDSTVTRAERVLAAAVDSDTRAARRIKAALREGRLLLTEVTFTEATAELAESSEAELASLAAALVELPGTFLVECHVVPNGGVKRAKLLSEERAATVKAWLVAAGVPAARLFTMGFGAKSQPPRVEIAHIQ